MMVRNIVTAALLLPILSSVGFALPPVNGFRGHSKGPVGKAVYFLSNDAANAVVALPINSDGTLSKGLKIPTGGEGSNIATNGDISMAQTPDALGSQGSVTVAGDYVFAVNAGSNTLSMLKASNNDASHLSLVGKPARLPGDFPSTVGVSQKHHLACVGFSGANSGVSCVPYSDSGLGKAGALYPFDLGQSTPPNSTLDLISQTFFSADESSVYTAVRGATGFFSSIPVESFGYEHGSQDVKSLADFTGALFGAFVVPGTNRVFAADPTVGVDLLAVDARSQHATLEKAVTVPGQKATCWIAQSAITNSVYSSDAGVDRLVELSLNDGSLIKIVDLDNGDPGMFDLAIGGSYIYALYAGNGTVPASVTVIDTEGRQGTMKQVQHFELSEMDISPNAVGMAVMM